MNHRDEVLADIKRTYLLYRRLEKSLSRPPFNRVFKNRNCKSAIKLAERREEVLLEMADIQDTLREQWMKLPEVRQSKGLQMTGTMLRFAAELAKSRRNPRYLKSQGKLGLTAQPEEAEVSPVGAVTP